MTKQRLFGSALPAIPLRPLLIAILCATPFVSLEAQDDDHDHDHDHLHFSHPMVTESPSPDTKFRLDYLGIRARDIIDLRESWVRLEGEYAFNRSVSLAIVTPYIWRTAPAAERANGIGNVEVSLKAASLALGERDILLGGGLSAELPTGSDTNGIGSGRLVELEPFVDAGYKRKSLELVGFVTLSTTIRRHVDEEAERNLTLDFSALYQFHPRLEGLIEVTSERALVGEESGSQQTFLAPGLKVYPFPNRQFMFGASIELGTGTAQDTRALLLSA